MGITNLQQVRVANLQELVYKQGQAGITKATVSIVFSNSDKMRSPIGYEDHDEITITRQVRRSRFLSFFVSGWDSRLCFLLHFFLS